MREQDLEDLFAIARAQPPLESGPLLARVLADAAQNQPKSAVGVAPRAALRKNTFWARISLAMGGNGVLAGLGTVAIAGIMLGLAEPAPLSALTDTIFAQTPLDEVDILADVDDILTEG